MEVVGAAVGAVLGSISNLLCGCVSSKMTTTLNLQSSLDVALVVTCLEDVEKLERRVNPIQEEKPSACFLNCNKRYRESREVEEILEEIKRLVQVVEHIPDVVYSTTIPKAEECIPGPSIPVQSTALNTFYKTMNLSHWKKKDEVVGLKYGLDHIRLVIRSKISKPLEEKK